tara:strand:+ start:2938 stop:3303 length:366 start_codon:yes stop_codon:yes gene_type:complete
MSIFTKAISVLTGGLGNNIENIAKEWITTAKESAEAKVIMIKALDPNGKMRRDLSKFACWAYGFYLINMVVLAYIAVFTDSTEAVEIMGIMKELFLPITAAWGSIVTASFGVNYSNVKAGN